MNSLMEFRQRVNRNALAASAQRSNEMLELQAMRDNAPVGAVGAPGGLPNMSGPASTGRDPLSGLLGLGAMLPGPTGDILGPIAEANMFYNEPASRTIGNYALAGIGALPAIPSLMYLMNRGGGQANRLAQARPGQAGMIGTVDPPEWRKKDSSRYGQIPVGINPSADELEKLFDATAKSGPTADLLRVLQWDDQFYGWPADLILHDEMVKKLGLKNVPRNAAGILRYEDAFPGK